MSVCSRIEGYQSTHDVNPGHGLGDTCDAKVAKNRLPSAFKYYGSRYQTRSPQWTQALHPRRLLSVT